MFLAGSVQSFIPMSYIQQNKDSTEQIDSQMRNYKETQVPVLPFDWNMPRLKKQKGENI
jgi:hypothetical protein